MKPNVVTASRIKQLRDERNYSQEDFSKDFSDFCLRDKEYAVITISSWESGRKLPPADVILQLARFYGCTTDYIMGLSDDPTLLRTSDKLVNTNQTIEVPFNELSKHDGEPLYIKFPDEKIRSQYGLLDFPNKTIQTLKYRLQLDPRCHYYITIPPEDLTLKNGITHLLGLEDVKKMDKVYIQSLSPDPYLQGLVSGWYSNDVSGKFLINEAGRVLSYEGLGVNYNAIGFKTPRQSKKTKK